jgi:hypothetical protein
MQCGEDQSDLFAVLQSELLSRSIETVVGANQSRFLNWSIKHDEFGFVATYPIDHLDVVANWVEKALGQPNTTTLTNYHPSRILASDGCGCRGH